LGQLGLVAQAAALCALLAGLWCVVAPLAYSLSGVAGLWAAAVGAGATLLGGFIALLLAATCYGPAAPMYGMLLGMMARMVVPMAIGVIVQLRVELLADAGMIFYLLGFYMATLALETAILLARIRLPFAPPKALYTK
jgi:hypothetical protein